MLLASDAVEVGEVPEVAVLVDPTAVPALGRDRRYAGDDRTGLVRVELDGTARVAEVRLAAGWHARAGIDGLGAAVVQAFAAAAAARLAGWAADARPGEAAVGLGSGPVPDAGRATGPAPGAELVSRVWRDVREYRLRLDELSAGARRIAGPDGQVVVAVQGGQVVGVELDPVWSTSASAVDLERSLGRALSAALVALAGTPDLALASCPDLRALLTGSPLPGLGRVNG